MWIVNRKELFQLAHSKIGFASLTKVLGAKGAKRDCWKIWIDYSPNPQETFIPHLTAV